MNGRLTGARGDQHGVRPRSPRRHGHADCSPDDGYADDAILEHLGLARSLARRFHGRGPEPDDLDQVADLGLVKAVRGFDPGRGRLAAYATATILGELKRHFRDAGWMIRPPRPLQELQGEIRQTIEDHVRTHGTAPTDRSLAGAIGESVPHIREARATVGCFAPQSIDTGTEPDGRPMIEALPAPDDGAFERVEQRASLAPLRDHLTEPDRVLLRMRFVEKLTQQEIADELGSSQMQISRRIGRVVGNLRRLSSMQAHADAARTGGRTRPPRGSDRRTREHRVPAGSTRTDGNRADTHDSRARRGT